MVHFDAGWSSSVARRAHNPKVAGSNPAPATTKALVDGSIRQGFLASPPACPTVYLTGWLFEAEIAEARKSRARAGAEYRAVENVIEIHDRYFVAGSTSTRSEQRSASCNANPRSSNEPRQRSRRLRAS